MKHLMADIAELHEAFDHPVHLNGHFCSEIVNAETSVALQGRLMLRLRLVAEEFFELLEGAVGMGGQNAADIVGARNTVRSLLGKWRQENDYNLVETADALTDLMVVIVGMALEMGIPLDHTWVEVHRSNMAKVQPDGTVKRREDGKVLKPEGWTKPDIEAALRRQPLTAKRLKESAQLDAPPEGSLERTAEVLGILPQIARNTAVEAKKHMLRKAIVLEAVRTTKMVDDGNYPEQDIEAHRAYIRLLCHELEDTPGPLIDDGPGT